MEKVIVGIFVKTHGIKGEIKIKSHFKYKDRVFIKGHKLYLEEKEFIINTYRVHQEYDMVTLVGLDNINEVLPFKGSKIYVNVEDLKLNNEEYLEEDLIGMNLYMKNIHKGTVTGIEVLFKNKKLLVAGKHYVPFELIKEIDLKNKKIILEEVDGLL